MVRCDNPPASPAPQQRPWAPAPAIVVRTLPQGSSSCPGAVCPGLGHAVRSSTHTPWSVLLWPQRTVQDRFLLALGPQGGTGRHQGPPVSLLLTISQDRLYKPQCGCPAPGSRKQRTLRECHQARPRTTRHGESARVSDWKRGAEGSPHTSAFTPLLTAELRGAVALCAWDPRVL